MQSIISRSRPSSSFGTDCIVNTTQTFPGSYSTYISIDVDFDDPLYPLSAFDSINDELVYKPSDTQTMLSPLCLAAFEGADDVIRFLCRFRKADEQEDLDLALFLANRQGHTETADLLLDYYAIPGQRSFSNGLHGAAWRGLKSQIYKYVNKHGADPDVADGSSATPVIYAIFGRKDEQVAWETIQCLFELGASTGARFGSLDSSYAEIAQKGGKEYLAQKFKEWEACPSPTILNSSRESSCMPGADNDVQPDNKRPQEGSEADGGANLSRESSCPVGGDDDVQPDNKRLREDSEVDGGAKRARGA